MLSRRLLDRYLPQKKNLGFFDDELVLFNSNFGFAVDEFVLC